MKWSSLTRSRGLYCQNVISLSSEISVRRREREFIEMLPAAVLDKNVRLMCRILNGVPNLISQSKVKVILWAARVFVGFVIDRGV